MNLIFIPSAFRESTTVDRESAGQLGDFVGGYVGTFFSLIGIWLLYETLRNQRITSTQQSFENKYFEMVKLHRDNVAEFELPSTSGRKVFVLIFRELQFAYMEVKKLTLELDQHLSCRELIQIAYYCVFFGVGPNSLMMLRNALDNFDTGLINAVNDRLSSWETRNQIQSKGGFKFFPFEGHQSRLGHYYRHLYQTILYVHYQTIDIDKYEYIKTVRAQLSTHEQAMLFVNSITPLGKNWWKQELIINYGLVKNIPRKFFEDEIDLELTTSFPSGYFEWEDN